MNAPERIVLPGAVADKPGYRAALDWLAGGPKKLLDTYAESEPVMSIGGHKQSGYGREMGPEAIDAYSQTKSC